MRWLLIFAMLLALGIGVYGLFFNMNKDIGMLCLVVCLIFNVLLFVLNGVDHEEED